MKTLTTLLSLATLTLACHKPVPMCALIDGGAVPCADLSAKATAIANCDALLQEFHQRFQSEPLFIVLSGYINEQNVSALSSAQWLQEAWTQDKCDVIMSKSSLDTAKEAVESELKDMCQRSDTIRSHIDWDAQEEQAIQIMNKYADDPTQIPKDELDVLIALQFEMTCRQIFTTK